MDRPSWGSVTPGSQQSQTCPAGKTSALSLLACLPWAQFGGIPDSRGAGLIHRSQAVGGQREERVGREKETRRRRSLQIMLCLLSSHAFIITLSTVLSTGPFHILVSSELPKSANLLPMVSHHLRTKTSSVWCLRWSMLWPLPPSQAPLPGPAHLQQ